MPANNTPFNGTFDDTITAPAAPIIANNQPPNIQTLTQKSGKSPSAVKVELEKKMRDLNAEQMNSPPNMLDVTLSPQAQVRIQAFNDLSKEYDEGNEPEESDEVTYDDLTQDIATDLGQDPAAQDFNMFAPVEQDAANQMFSDIDTINQDDPLEPEPTQEPLDMDALSKIADPEDDSYPESNLPDENIPDIPEE